MEVQRDDGQATVLTMAALVLTVLLLQAVLVLGRVVVGDAAAQAAADAVALAAVVDPAMADPVAAANEAVVITLRRVPGRVQVTVERYGRQATATAELAGE